MHSPCMHSGEISSSKRTDATDVGLDNIAANSAHSYSTAGGTMFGSVLMTPSWRPSAPRVCRSPICDRGSRSTPGWRARGSRPRSSSARVRTSGPSVSCARSTTVGASVPSALSRSQPGASSKRWRPSRRTSAAARRTARRASPRPPPRQPRYHPPGGAPELDAVTAIQYVNMFPVPPTRNPRMPLNHPHLFSYTVSGCPRSSARSRSHSDSA